MVDCPIDSTEKKFLLLSKIPKRFMWTLQKMKIPMKDCEEVYVGSAEDEDSHEGLRH